MTHTYTDQELIDRVVSNARGFDSWIKGKYDIWVRSNPQHMDAFEDKVYSFLVPEDDAVPEFQMVCTGTSHAGSYGLKHFKDYNPQGCAVLQANRFVRGSHVRGLHKGQYPAYVQAKPWPYYRDNDLDNYAEELGPEHYDIIGAECHHAAFQGVSTVIYNWSVACLVRNAIAQWNRWFGYMGGVPLNNCILEEW